MIAVADTIINRYEAERYTYYQEVIYDSDNGYTSVKGTYVDTPNNLSNVCLAPVQYTGLTGSGNDTGNGHPFALAPDTNSPKWKLAVDVAEDMVKIYTNPDSFEMLDDLEGVTSYRSSSIYYKDDEGDLYSKKTKKKVADYGKYKDYGGNTFFLK